MHLPGIEPGTFRVWGERDNHYTTSAKLFPLVGFLSYANNILLIIFLSYFLHLN